MLNHERIVKEINSNSSIAKFNFKPAKQPATGFSIQKELFLQLPKEMDSSKSISQQIMDEKTTAKIKKFKRIAAQNYDLNMDYYSKLNHDEYLNALDLVISKYELREIDDLDEVKGISGDYLLCLDDFHQFYFSGGNLRTEITKTWYSPSNFMVSCERNYSLEIRNFGIFDTKRIFVNSDKDQIDYSLLTENEVKMIKKEFKSIILENKFYLPRWAHSLQNYATPILSLEFKHLFASEEFQNLAQELSAGPHSSEEKFKKFTSEQVYEIIQQSHKLIDEVDELPKMITRLMGPTGIQRIKNLDL